MYIYSITFTNFHSRMLAFKFVKPNKFRINLRHIATECQSVSDSHEQVSNIQTSLDKNGKIIRFSENKNRWESVIGLEVHAQINVVSKEIIFPFIFINVLT